MTEVTEPKLSEPGLLSRDAKKWRNAWCDRQMIWAHEHHKREFFVTSDNNFFRMNGHQDFLDITVIKPIDAVSMLV